MGRSICSENDVVVCILVDLRGRFCVKLIRIVLGGRRDIKLVGIGGELRWERFEDEEKYWKSIVGSEKI